MYRVVYLLLMMTPLAATPKAGAAEWRLDPRLSHDVQQSQHDDSLRILTTGSDPYVVGRIKGNVDENDRVLEFEYFSTTGVKDFSAIVGPPISERGRAILPPILIAEGWQIYSSDLATALGKPLTGSRLLRFDLGTVANTRIRIRNLRLRPPNKQEVANAVIVQAKRDAQIARAAALKTYLLSDHTRLIDSVEVLNDQVLISIPIKKFNSSIGNDFFQTAKLSLRELRPYHDVAHGQEVPQAHVTRDDQALLISIPRMDEDYDRANSAWRFAREGIHTARRYPTKIAASSIDHAKDRHTPKNQKGLSGLSKRGPQSDFVDLGIASVTVNVSLNSFVSSRNGPNCQRISAPGPPVFFNPAPFAHYDQSIDFARKHDMVVSAIVLIPSPKRTNTRSPLIHPDTNGGTYAMPDLTTPRGVAIYTHVLHAIAKRYRNHTRAPGGITNWIAHNEIDFHTIWTNMGRQPREIVTECYYRSMRLIHNVARQHNPHARVFASLTHHWNVPDDARWQRLSPRELLKDLQRYSELEGDFAWGVAYHPYPQSLFAKVAWEDKRVADNFDTPLITIQNLQVLGRFLRQPSMNTSDGFVRPVILSEQGFHTDSYEQESQDRQAGSLAWTMQRLSKMPWIESFIYHRWIDHPAEGGLMLGLRTLPSKQHPHGERKRSWHVYQAIGTERQQDVTKDLPGPKKHLGGGNASR